MLTLHTAFIDGRQFGMGSEIGISTQKLHALGPMVLEALTSLNSLYMAMGTSELKTDIL